MFSNMLLFTPDRYNKLQSTDIDVACLIEEEWEQRLEEYEKWIKDEAPPLVNEFYQKTLYLHDSRVLRIEPRRGKAELEFLREFGDKPKILIRFDYDASCELEYKDWVPSRVGQPEYLYDEFQLIECNGEKILRYVFYTSIGLEYTFDNVRNFQYEEQNQDPEVSQVPQGPA